MDNKKQIQEALLQAVDTMIDNKLKKLNFNYYVDGVIQDGAIKSNTINSRSNGKNVYDVSINGTVYKNIPSMSKFDYRIGDTVQILIKNGDWNKKYITDMAYHSKFPTAQQYNSIDKEGVEYPLICDNTTNLWIGALERKNRHHHGRTMVSAGYNPSTGSGYPTIGIAVPNDENNDAEVYETLHNKNLIDYVYPVGSICIRETKSDPVSTLGGTWTLVDKEFTSLYIEDTNNTYFTPNTDVVSSCTVRIVRTGHTITIKIYVTIPETVSLTDTSSTLGSLNYEALGISELPTNRSFPIGYSDGGNAIMMGYLYGDTGALTVNDIVGADSVSGTSVYFDFTETITSNYMLNTACNKFYWKRKA